MLLQVLKCSLDLHAYLVLLCNEQLGGQWPSVIPLREVPTAKAALPHVRAGQTEPCSQGGEQGGLGWGIPGGFLEEATFR